MDGSRNKSDTGSNRRTGDWERPWSSVPKTVKTQMNSHDKLVLHPLWNSQPVQVIKQQLYIGLKVVSRKGPHSGSNSVALSSRLHSETLKEVWHDRKKAKLKRHYCTTQYLKFFLKTHSLVTLTRLKHVWTNSGEIRICCMITELS